MEKIAAYRDYAAQCRDLAAQMKLPPQREQLLQMANAWEAMAQESERLRRNMQLAADT